MPTQAIDERPPEYLSDHYEPLPKRPTGRRGNLGAIRILRLFPSTYDNPQIDSQLITPTGDSEGNISPTKPYEALSWCWGTSGKTSYIRITKGEKSYAKYVAPNLFAALRALRHHQDFRYLWVDAICIDQDDLDEKNHQVEMMDEIYGNAVRVCIWLGEAEESSTIALDFINNEVLKLQNFDDLCERPETSPKWRALLELMQRDWFSRRWVVQEIALARSAVIYCGKDKISWSKFAVAVELFVEVETATHRLSEVMKKDPKYYHVPGWFEYVSALGASLLVDATGRLFRDYKVEESSKNNLLLRAEDESDTELKYESEPVTVDSTGSAKSSSRSVRMSVGSNSQENKGPPLLSLEYLVSSLSIFNTTVPHDTIYALLAISKNTTPYAAETDLRQSSKNAQDSLEIFMQRKRYNVDYKLPYVDVCKEFIQFCIDQSRQIDKSRALDVICRPWATEEKDLEIRRRKERITKINKESERRRNEVLKSKRRWANGNSENNAKAKQPVVYEKVDTARYIDMPLPSWVPQLSNAPYAMYSQPGIAGIKMSRKNADPLVGLPSMTQRNYSAAETKSVDMKSLKFRKRCELGHFSMYVKGFVLDTITNVSQLSRNGQIPEEWTELGGWSGADGDPPDDFWRTLVANRGRDQKNPPVYYARACKESFTKGGYMGGAVDTTALINYEQNSVVAQFCRRVQAVTWNRALVRTKSDKLGLVGKNVQSDDLVCILYGCSVPIILRKSNRKDDAIFNAELEWELKFLTDNLRTYVKRWMKRVSEHRERKEQDKQKYFEWEIKKCREWLLPQRESGQIKAGELLRKLDEEVKLDCAVDETIRTARDLWEKSYAAAKKYEQAKAGKNPEAVHKAEEVRTTQKLYERAKSRKKYYLQFLNEDLIMAREFQNWKYDAMKAAIKQKGLPAVDWREFELCQKYGLRWQKIMKTRSERIRKKVKEEVERMEIERKSRIKKGLPVSQNVHSQQESKPMPDGSTSRGDEGSPLRSEIDPSNADTQTLNMAKFNSNTGEQDEFAKQEAVQSWRSISGETTAKHKSGQRASDVFDDDSDETDWEDNSWQRDTRQLYETMEQLKTKQKIAWDTGEWEEYRKLQMEKEDIRDSWKDSNWKLYRQREEFKKKKRLKERRGNASVEEGHIRWKLTEEAGKRYDKKIRKNLKKSLGYDGLYYYQFLGECYLHGVMDGEAMAYQNGKEQKGKDWNGKDAGGKGDEQAAIPWTVFELR